jgi:uncharacterized protein YoxC
MDVDKQIEKIKKEIDNVSKHQKKRGVQVEMTLDEYKEFLKTVKELREVFKYCKRKKPDEKFQAVLEYYTKRIKEDEQ